MSFPSTAKGNDRTLSRRLGFRRPNTRNLTVGRCSLDTVPSRSPRDDSARFVRGTIVALSRVDSAPPNTPLIRYRRE